MRVVDLGVPEQSSSSLVIINRTTPLYSWIHNCAPCKSKEQSARSPEKEPVRQAFRTMALRRASQSLAGRLLQGQVPALSVAGVRAGPVLPQQEDDQSRSTVCANNSLQEVSVWACCV